MIGQDLLRDAVLRLKEASVEDPLRDARRLFAHALGIDASRLTMHLHDPVSEENCTKFQTLITRRVRREPVSHLTGTRAFYGRDFYVSADVLDPRPETETLIETALTVPFERVLDLGTGSGCVLATLLCEREDSHGLGTDISQAALSIAERNLSAHQVMGRTQLYAGRWYDALPSATAPFDLIVSNPPYIALNEMDTLAPEVRDFEPRIALTDEGDGLEAYRAIRRSAAQYLKHSGWLMVEIGPTQADAVMRLMQDAGLVNIAKLPDLDGRDRVIKAQNPSKIA
jgi:release factor glutamine methyltransferase